MRPTMKRQMERWSRVGNASTTQTMRHLSTPSKKNARTRARVVGLHPGCWVKAVYRRAHCCNNVANRVSKRMINKLRKKHVFVQMAYTRGENSGGSGGMDARELFGSVGTCWMLLRWNVAVS